MHPSLLSRECEQIMRSRLTLFRPTWQFADRSLRSDESSALATTVPSTDGVHRIENGGYNASCHQQTPGLPCQLFRTIHSSHPHHYRSYPQRVRQQEIYWAISHPLPPSTLQINLYPTMEQPTFYIHINNCKYVFSSLVFSPHTILTIRQQQMIEISYETKHRC
jgi:hypothetical protein